MKKTLKLFLVMTFIVSALVLSVAAAGTPKFTFSLVESTETAGGYDVVVHVSSPGGKVNAVQVVLTFNNEILLPADCADYTAVALDKVVDEPVFLAETKVGKKTYTYALPADPTWKTSGNKTTVTVDCYTTDGDKFDAENLDLMTISFTCAAGKKVSDLKNGDFTVDSLYIADGVNGEFAYNRPGTPNPVPFENTIVPPEPEDLTISVKKDDIVYFQDDSVVKIAEDNGKYPLPSKADGYVVVNSGFTAQKLYKVTSGAIAEVSSNETGVLATDSASLRKDSVATGLRFKSSFATALKNTVKEYGYLVTVESAYNALPADYVLNMDLVTAGKAKKGIAFNKADGTDIFFDVDGARTVVTAVATNIPLTKDAVTTNIVARPYYELEDGTIVYGETVKRQAAEVAQKIKAEDAETYAKYKDYIDAIVALVAEDPTYAIIDLGPLFS